MWFAHSPHGLREITDDEILARAEQIKASRTVTGPVLSPCQIPGTRHVIPSTHNHNHGGCSHAYCCHGCPRR